MAELAIPNKPGGVHDRAAPGGPDSGPPVVLNGYRDFVPVAKGGDSVVYRAVQEGINRAVAVKVLTPGDGGAPSARYLRELEITVRLGQSHPNIVNVYATQILDDGRPCIIMPYFPLGSLQDQLRAYGRLPASAAVAACTVVADALAFAHGEGVLHRDVKPQNILVLPTSFVLADFGLARPADAGETSSLGRFSYRHASPQVLDGELPTVADDIYSLGSTLFTLLDGRPPFAVDERDSDSALAYLRRARSDPPRPIRSSDATPDLLQLIDRCLAKGREDRFPHAQALHDALRLVVTGARVWSKPWRPAPLRGRAPAPPAETPAAPVLPPPALRPVAATPAPVTAPPPAALTAPASAPPAGPPPVPGPATVQTLPPAPVLAAPPPAGDPTAPPPPLPGGPQWTEGVDGDDDTTEEHRGGRKRGPWVRVLTALVLAGGAGIAIGVLWVAVQGQPGDGPHTRPVTTYTGALPTGVPTLAIDAALTPQITAANLRRESVDLAWTDPSGGEARFVVLRLDADGGQAILHVDPGTTAATVSAAPAGEAGSCYRVLAVDDEAQTMGASPVRCADPPANG